jgi:hypothetical protein
MENTSPDPLFHKPPSIVAAKNILYTVMFLAVVIWTINRFNYGVLAGQAILELVVVLAVLFASTKAVTLGVKWARVVLLILFLLGLIPYLTSFADIWHTRLVVAVLTLLEFILEAVAIRFLFRQESTLWFNRVKEKALKEPRHSRP